MVSKERKRKGRGRGRERESSSVYNEIESNYGGEKDRERVMFIL